jgi:hypothetical protein
MQPEEAPRPGPELSSEEIDRRIQESVHKAFKELANGR